MKILIVSMIFYPQNRIGAIRPTNFAKHLKALGHEVTVVTTKKDKEREVFNFPCEIIEVGRGLFVKFIDRILDRHRQGRESLKNQDEGSETNRDVNMASKKIIFLQIIDIVKGKDFVRKSMKILKKNFEKNEFDIVISSYGPVGSLYLGEKIKRKAIAQKWICDYRDRLASSIFPGWLKNAYLKIERSAYKYADSTFQVSKGTIDDFKRDLGIEKGDSVHIITNGFENTNEHKKLSNEDKLVLCYTGSLYTGGKSSFRLLIDVLKGCIDEGLIEKNKVRIDYAGKSGNELDRQIKQYGLNVFENHGFVSGESAVELQNSSDILLVLSWNTEKEKGVITGKFYEYLAVKKPVIALISGIVEDAELSQMIVETRVGISCEEADYEAAYAKLKEYIMMQYQRKQKGQDLLYEAVDDEVCKYDYVNLTERLESICRDLMSS